METRRIKRRGRAGCSLTAGGQQQVKHGLEELSSTVPGRA